MRNKLVRLCCIAAISTSVFGCLPRGESHSLDQVFNDARGSYISESLAGGAPAEVSEQLKRVTVALDGFAGVNGVTVAPPSCNELADTLQGLSTHANYTVRPALAEIVNQLRGLEAGGKKVEVGTPTVKLLASRIYTLLTSELTTTKFKV